VLQYVEVCGSVLQCVAVCFSVLQCVAVCCSELQCVAVCCHGHSSSPSKHCGAVRCGMLVAVYCRVMLCVAGRNLPALYNTLYKCVHA